MFGSFDRDRDIVSADAIDFDLDARVPKRLFVPSARPMVRAHEDLVAVFDSSENTIVGDAIISGGRDDQNRSLFGLEDSDHRLESDDEGDVADQQADHDLGGFGHGGFVSFDGDSRVLGMDRFFAEYDPFVQSSLTEGSRVESGGASQSLLGRIAPLCTIKSGVES